MPSLEDLKNNAIPPQEESNIMPGVNGGPARYIPNPNGNRPKSKPVEVSAMSLGTPEPAPPTIMDKMMGDLDLALERDKRDMWKNVIAPAKDAYENNVAFGVGGDDNYFNGEIGVDTGNTPSITPNNNTITLTEDQKASLPSFGNQNTTIPNIQVEDDFLSSDDIYKEEDVRPMATENTTSVPFVPTNNHIETPVVETAEATPIPVPVREEDTIPTMPREKENKVDQNYVTYSNRFIDEAFGDEEVDEDATVDNEDVEAMRTVIKSEIKPVNNVIDLRTYKISSKPVTAGRVMNEINTELPSAKWVLPATGTGIIMSALKGIEIELLANRREGQTNLMRNQEIVQTFYNHIVGDKPATWEAWAKSVVYDDFFHLYFAEYLACFSNANFAPYECEHDKHSFMQRVELMSMVKYKDDNAKQVVDALLKKDCKIGSIDCEFRQVSDKFVIAFRKPTIWNVMFEDYYLPDKIRNEMRDVVGIFNHISDIYLIDRATGELRPIDTKPIPGDMTKTLKNRFKIYYDILKSLTSDQYTAITPIIVNLHKDSDLISYQYPETVCPKCGSVIPAREDEPLNMLFLRHQLQSILVS